MHCSFNMRQVVSILNDFAQLFFPQICAGCGGTLPSPAPVCLHCMNELPLTNFHLYADNPVEKYFWGRMPVTAAASMCHFTEGSLIQRLLHQLKYNGHQDVGVFLGRMMGRTLQQTDRFNHIDALVPLPLFASRQKKRGYNQSETLCTGMAAVLNLPVINHAVVRLAATATQTHKNRTERWANMADKFEVTAPGALKGRHILLVDDVTTTGATLEACGQAILTTAGASISIATLAYTV